AARPAIARGRGTCRHDGPAAGYPTVHRPSIATFTSIDSATIERGSAPRKEFCNAPLPRRIRLLPAWQDHLRVGSQPHFGQRVIGRAFTREDERRGHGGHVDALVTQALERETITGELIA